ncbi:MAG: hypothetical protein R2794_09350 [Chitinophagales bacterium]
MRSHSGFLRILLQVTVLFVFTATVICKDAYHLIGHTTEVVCNGHDSTQHHFHTEDHCALCDFHFSTGSSALALHVPASPCAGAEIGNSPQHISPSVASATDILLRGPPVLI